VDPDERIDAERQPRGGLEATLVWFLWTSERRSSITRIGEWPVSVAVSVFTQVTIRGEKTCDSSQFSLSH